MATANENYITLMTESLQKKIVILTEIARLNGEQSNILAQSPFDIDLFDENVHRKAEQIDRLEILDDGFNALFARVREVIDANRAEYAESIKTIQGLIIKITDLSVEIEAGEKRNKVVADRQFSTLKKEIKEAKRSSQMATKYYRSMSHFEGTPQFVDKKN